MSTASPATDQAAAPLAGEPESSGEAGATTPIKVLVVDDDASITEALIDFLSMMGVEATSRNNADEGLQVVIEDPGLTVVVSDVRMPGRDGIGFAADIAAARQAQTAVSVVLITAFTSSAVAAVIDRQQIFAFLQKPFRPNALLEMIRLAHEAAVNRRRQSMAPAPVSAPVRDTASGEGRSRPADIIQGVAAGIPKDVINGRQICTAADSVARLGVESGRMEEILGRLVAHLIGLTSSGTVLTLSAVDSGPRIEFRIDFSPSMLGDLGAAAAPVALDEEAPLLASITADIARVGGHIAFAPHPTALTLSCRVIVDGIGGAADIY